MVEIIEFNDELSFCFSFAEHHYIHEGRLRYHSCMCRCCVSTPNGRQYSHQLEPVRGFRYDDSDEYFSTLRQGKGQMLFELFRSMNFHFLFRIHAQIIDGIQSSEHRSITIESRFADL